MIYQYNSSNVVINPTVFFKYIPKDNLAWVFFELRYGKCINGKWDYGYNIMGGSSPVCVGSYETETECKKEAINFMKEYFKKYKDLGVDLKKPFEKGKKAFQLFLNTQFLKKESQTTHLIHVLDNGKNYTQASLF
ncbi:hypothetical protein [Tenacibaculum maritimum]|uniref:hypothetical protein n=1 Tax=Tenacibaculum maritimum TaxID=107401 RepID=UPI003877609B